MATIEADLDDLLSEQAITDPFSYYSRLRQIDPVYWNQRWNGWIVTGYEEVVAAHRHDSGPLSVEHLQGPFGEDIRDAPAGYSHLLDFLSKMFPFRDPPDHTRIRSVVSKALIPKNVERLRPKVRDLIVDLILPLRGRGEVDFISEFAFGLPLIVIAELLGVPREARFELREWSNELAGVIVVRAGQRDRLERGETAMRALVEFLRPLVRARRERPKDDLLSHMLHAGDTGEALSEEEVIANAVAIIFAGHETTTHLLANGIVAFSRFPDAWDRMRREPDIVRTATEEVLRYDSPVRAMARWAKEPFDLCGHPIAAGDRLLLVQHAANHDPAAFDNPEELVVDRWPNRHVAFGQGIHTCVGAALARMEAQEAFSYLSSEFEAVEVLEHDLSYEESIITRGLTRLPVRLREG